MKKIFTLMTGLLLTVAMFAADHRPTVTINSMGSARRFEVVIDGRTYANAGSMLSITNLRSGNHSIKVYETSRGFSFFKRKQLVSSSLFQLRNQDIRITLDRFGNISISQDRFDRYDRGRDQRDWNDRDRDGHSHF